MQALKSNHQDHISHAKRNLPPDKYCVDSIQTGLGPDLENINS